MIYGYKCRPCTQTYTSEERNDRLTLPDGCITCSDPGPLVRDYRGLSLHRPMMDHFNASVQQPISSMRQYEDVLKQKSEDAFLGTGIEHQYEPCDITDTKRLGVTEEGLDYTNRDRARKGLATIDLRMIH